MKYYLAKDAILKWLEVPSVYNIKTDELYELDDESFDFIKRCSYSDGCASDDMDFTDYCVAEGILSVEPSEVNHPPVFKSPDPSLRYLELQVTDSCNLRCRHCYINAQFGNELSVNQIDKILSEFEEMQGLRVLITGGEPLMHSSFMKINELLPDYAIRKVLFTNGLLLNSNILRILNVNEIQISIDGLESAHDALRGKGTFNEAIKAIRIALDHGFDVSVSTMVHAKNLGDFDRLDDLFKRIGIKDWTVDVPCLTGRLEANKDFYVAPEIGGRYLKYGYGTGLHVGQEGYGCGLHLMSVMADGKAAKCTFFSKKPAGIISEGLRMCWERIKPVRLVDLECNCEYIETCRGGCRYRAELLGNKNGRDLYKCYLFDIIKDNNLD